VRQFDPPDEVWQAGHRGVDLAGQVGDLVTAAAAGVVHFAGQVAGRGVVSLDHGSVTTTYEPISPLVQTGDRVDAGMVIGRLEAGHPCSAEACLHWGLRQGTVYLNPLFLLAPQTVRLISLEAVATLQRQQAEWERAQAEAGLARPVAGPVTSPFGYRTSPITGARELHDGTDFGAACGTPIQAAATGVVTQQYADAGYGNRVIVDHGSVGGHRLVTAYNHLSAFALAVGSVVERGALVGYVGTTGWSTGCHLHFIVWVDGALTDPMPLLR
jgi:murein DD-endopeptidase MepM/ murein hydrolase activator NlpD